MTTSALVDRTSYDEASEAQKLSAAVSACDVNKFGDSDLKNSSVAAAAPWLKTSVCDLSFSTTNESDAEGLKTATTTLSSVAIRKQQTPLLTNPPRLARRFADLELTTGDCQVSEDSDDEDVEELKKELRQRERQQSGALTLAPPTLGCTTNSEGQLKGDQEKSNKRYPEISSKLWKFKLFSHLKIHTRKSRSSNTAQSSELVIERSNPKLQLEKVVDDEDFEQTEETELMPDDRRPDQDDLSGLSDSVGDVSKPKPRSTLNFRPRADIFHLLNDLKNRLLVRRPSFFSVSESSVDSTCV